MLKHLEGLNLESYGLYVNSTAMKCESNVIGLESLTIDMAFSMPSYAPGNEQSVEDLERFFLDLKMLNALKNNTNSAVKKHYEELLLLLALSNDEKEEKDK